MDEINFSNYQEFLAYWKSQTNLDQNNIFYQAMLETLEDAAATEQKGHQVDPATIFEASIKKAQVFVKTTPEAR